MAGIIARRSLRVDVVLGVLTEEPMLGLVALAVLVVAARRSSSGASARPGLGLSYARGRTRTATRAGRTGGSSDRKSRTGAE